MGTVILSGAAPSGGAVVKLASGDGTIAAVPPSVTVTAGASGANFTVTTTAVSSTTSVTISGVYAGSAKTALLNVDAVDSVKIQSAEYVRSTNFLTAEATSTEPNAVLRAYITGSGTLIGTLKNNGGGSFSGLWSWPTRPKNITVRSSFGGSASKSVTVR